MKRINLTQKDRKDLKSNINKIIGQLQAVSNTLDNDEVNEQIFIQLLAVKGGASRICKEIIFRGVVKNLDQYSEEEINRALEIIFKLD